MKIVLFWAITLVLTAQLLLSASEDVNCAALQESCRNLSMLMQSVADLPLAPWPVITQYINEHRGQYQTYCRYSKEAGQCFRNLTMKCRTWSEQQGGAPFAAVVMQGESLVAMGRLCDLFPEPLRLLAAQQHCEVQDAGHLFRFTLPDVDPELHNQTRESLLTATCSAVRETAIKIKGEHSEELLQKCGSEAADVVTEGMDKMFTAWECPLWISVAPAQE
ncbi:uncharacterized protein LOC129595888 [Paramacrobiotus metropolitanus]|uniref:uncharacterized protein LOC129595888 n=1 Tax=Paramacrobiotus metropolitanus TaxID=2943436 RepID=UPI002446433F|nr:uncharacterized protein LOC129595888 [Paramacrobiotus metropolitanus]